MYDDLLSRRAGVIYQQDEEYDDEDEPLEEIYKTGYDRETVVE